MSSTTIPIVIATTTDSASPTSPFASPQTPNPATAGTKLGTRLMSPSRNERSAATSTMEIARSAIVVPSSIARMLRCPMWENMSAVPEPSAEAMFGAFLSSHASALVSRSSVSCEESVLVVTVIRVADRETSIRWLRSRPKGSESS